MEKNLLLALFSYRPREGRMSSEDFLTEAFAHVLKSDASISKAWIARVAEGTVQSDKIPDDPEIDTQQVFDLPGGRGGQQSIRVDMLMQFKAGDEAKRTYLFEHKWPAETDTKQLDNYKAVLAGLDGGEARNRLVFIADTVTKRETARGHCDLALLWSDVFKFLESWSDSSPRTRELLEFMDLQGLGPQSPLSVGKIAAYTHSADVPSICRDIAQELSGRSWNFLPQIMLAQRPWYVHSGDRWGRVGIDFWGKTIKRNVFAGFYLTTRDHGFDFCRPESGFDLMLCVERTDLARPFPTAAFDSRKQAVLDALQNEDAMVLDSKSLIDSDPRRFVIKEPLAEILRGTATREKQVNAIYDRFRVYCSALLTGPGMESVMEEFLPFSAEPGS